jgi:hypothetical protein
MLALPMSVPPLGLPSRTWLHSRLPFVSSSPWYLQYVELRTEIERRTNGDYGLWLIQGVAYLEAYRSSSTTYIGQDFGEFSRVAWPIC